MKRGRSCQGSMEKGGRLTTFITYFLQLYIHIHIHKSSSVDCACKEKCLCTYVVYVVHICVLAGSQQSTDLQSIYRHMKRDRFPHVLCAMCYVPCPVMYKYLWCLTFLVCECQYSSKFQVYNVHIPIAFLSLSLAAHCEEFLFFLYMI